MTKRLSALLLKMSNTVALLPAETSAYRTIDSTFGYAPMEMSINNEEIRQGVTDFVGESTIPNGNYTYELTYGPDQYRQGCR